MVEDMFPILMKTPGFYTVNPTCNYSNGLDITVDKTLVVCDYGHTALADTLYNLIDHYIPSEISEGNDRREINPFTSPSGNIILDPLVNHHNSSR